MPKKRWPLQSAGLSPCALALILSATASLADPSESPFTAGVWSTEEGLPQSSVISVIQSHDGYLWLGTLNGLVRFDGIHFTVFDENNLPGLNSDRIVFLFEDSRTNLWVGTESSGLEMIKNGLIKNFSAETAGDNKTVTYATEDSPGDILFYSASGIFLYRNGQIVFSPGTVSPDLFLLAQRAVVPSASGGYWQMLNGTVWKFNKERSGKNFGPTPWGNVMVKAALEDSQGNLIVGTLGAGVFWSDTAGHWQNISTNQGLSSPYVLSLCLDRSGNLWVGTDGGGLDRIKRKNFNMPGGIPPFVAQSVAEDADGGMWTAFNAHGAYYWKTNTVENFGPAQGLDLNTWTVLVDKKQTVWVGTRNQGFSQFETNRFIPAPGTEILGPKNFALFEDRNGQLWAGTQNGLAHFDGRSWKLFTVRDGLSGNSIRAIAQDTNGDFWIGTESSGLNFLANGKFTSIQKSENGLPCDDISCLFVDDGNNLWVGTFGHGLARLQNGKWTHFSTDNGLASDSISYIIEDSEGYLWLGSNAGLMRIRKKSLDDFAANPTNSIFCRVYGKTDGLPTCECSFGSEPAAISAHNGELFLPTTKGVVSVNPAALKPNLQPLTVSIEAVFVNGRRQNANFPNAASPRMITIPPGSEQLEIDYTALNFSAPELVRFKYRLEGHENLWTDAGSGRVARFPKLPPGNYRFRVIAENEDGIWNEMGAVLTIIVQPYWWQTMSFHVAVIILLLTLVAAVVRYLSTQKLHRQLQALKQREALEKERFRIAHDLHDQLGANLTQVALLGDMVGTDKNSPVDVASHAEQISQTARETTHALDEIVWAVNPSNDTLDGLITYACKYAQEYLAVAGVRYRAEVPAQLPAVTIPPEVRHNVFLAFKEAVNNVVKHAQASEVWVRLHLLPNRFILEIEDNGRGISSMDSTPGRNGLRNMKKRMEDLYGEFSIAGGAKGGTVVRLVAPLSRKTA